MILFQCFNFYFKFFSSFWGSVWHKLISKKFIKCWTCVYFNKRFQLLFQFFFMINVVKVLKSYNKRHKKMNRHNVEITKIFVVFLSTHIKNWYQKTSVDCHKMKIHKELAIYINKYWNLKDFIFLLISNRAINLFV